MQTPNSVSVSLDKETRRLGKKVLQVYQDSDQEANSRASMRGARCKSQCRHCCYNVVLVTIPEAVVIAEYIMTSRFWSSDKDVEAFMAKLYKQIAVFEDPTAEEHQYARNGMPCVFLDQEKGTCQTYDQRPSACRYHFVTSDPQFCRVDQSESSADTIDMKDLEQKVVVAARRIAEQVDIPHVMVPMAIGVSWALKSLSEGTRVFNASAEFGVMNLKFWQKVHPVDEASDPVDEKEEPGQDQDDG